MESIIRDIEERISKDIEERISKYNNMSNDFATCIELMGSELEFLIKLRQKLNAECSKNYNK